MRVNAGLTTVVPQCALEVRRTAAEYPHCDCRGLDDVEHRARGRWASWRPTVSKSLERTSQARRSSAGDRSAEPLSAWEGDVQRDAGQEAFVAWLPSVSDTEHRPAAIVCWVT